MNEKNDAESSAGDVLEELVYLSRMTQEERQQLYRVDAAFKRFGLKEHALSLKTKLVDDRFIRAKSCLEAAQFLISQAGTVTSDLRKELLRSAVTKGYYSIHHAIRAILLFENGWEEDGHAKALKALAQLLKNEDFRKRSELESGINKELAIARDNRSVADYSPYDFSRREAKTKENSFQNQQPASDVAREAATVEFIYLTAKDWHGAALHNLDLAQKLIHAANRIKTRTKGS